MMAGKPESGKTGGSLTDEDRQRLAAMTLLSADRIGATVSRREYLTVLAAGLLPSAWLARASQSRGGE